MWAPTSCFYTVPRLVGSKGVPRNGQPAAFGGSKANLNLAIIYDSLRLLVKVPDLFVFEESTSILQSWPDVSSSTALDYPLFQLETIVVELPDLENQIAEK